MAFEKHELKLLLKELKNIFATKKELKDLDIDIDLDSIDIAYVGEEEPENNNAIWFDSGEKNKHEISYDNPVIDELFMCIRTLQDQVKKLQEDVEYLKINGGSNRPPKEDDEDDDVVNVIFALEDGGLFLLEDGGYLLTEESVNVPVTNSPSLTLENGSLFLLEDGGIIILEESINKITDSLLLLENGAKMLMENNSYMILEK